jgi:homoaconitase/3-isopropylmalate dehydratase large subunit
MAMPAHSSRVRSIVGVAGTVGWIRAGQAVAISPSYVMTHDNTAAVMIKFKGLGAAKIANPSQVVFTLDHNVQVRRVWVA